MDLTKENYLKNPCRAASIPYWKAVSIPVPQDMKVLHDAHFSGEALDGYTDEPYFRLFHDLRNLTPGTLPPGYDFCAADAEVFAAHIRSCYPNVDITAETLGWDPRRKVYCPALWVAVKDLSTGKVVATGIGELDPDTGEGTLEWIQVSEGHRGRGLGKCVVNTLLWRLGNLAKFATVSGQCRNPTNPEALYRSCGFTGNDVWHILRKVR